MQEILRRLREAHDLLAAWHASPGVLTLLYEAEGYTREDVAAALPHIAAAMRALRADPDGPYIILGKASRFTVRNGDHSLRGCYPTLDQAIAAADGSFRMYAPEHDPLWVDGERVAR